jgi:hypothetical protein
MYLLIERHRIDLTTKENLYLLGEIFAAKRVPLNLISKIRDTKEFHREDFIAVRATVGRSSNLESFDYYFDYIVAYCERPLRGPWDRIDANPWNIPYL